MMHLGVLKKFLTPEELQQVVEYHYQISQGLGIPVGLINMFHRVPPTGDNELAYTQQYPIENLHDRVQNMLVQLLEKTHTGAVQTEDTCQEDDVGAMINTGQANPFEEKKTLIEINAARIAEIKDNSAQAWNDQLP